MRHHGIVRPQRIRDLRQENKAYISSWEAQESELVNKVLISPAHYVLDDEFIGSEPMWVSSMLKGIANSGRYKLYVVTGTVVSLDINYGRCKIFELRDKPDIDPTLARRLTFTFRKTAKSKLLGLKHEFSVVHHIFPFWIGVTFDMDFILRSKKSAYVIGPIQSPHSETIEAHSRVDSFFYSSLGSITRYLSMLTLRRADKVIALTSHAKGLLVAEGLDEGKIQVITPGINTDKFRYVPFDEKPEDRIVLVAVGYLSKRKGMEFVVKAFADVLKRHDKALLRIIGNGSELGSIKELARSLGLEDHIEFLGYVPHSEIQAHYRDAHVFVSMSRAESWGQVYLEAMASGMPVVTSENVGSREIVRDGVFGYLIDQEDTEMLAETLNHLLDNRQLIAEFGRKAREEAESRYDWEKVIVPKYLELYDSLSGR